MPKFLLFCLFLSISQVNAQIIEKWSTIYQECGGFIDTYRQNNLVCSDKNNVLVIDQKYMNTSPFLTRSENGGITWDTIYRTNPFEYDINSIAFPSSERIVWVGDTTIYQGYEGNFNYFYKKSGIICTSTDGGLNWFKTKIDTNTVFDYVVMLNNNVGIANKRGFLNRYNSKISYYDTLFYTTNFFQTYTKIPVPDSMTYVKEIFMFSEDNFVIKILNSPLKKQQYWETQDRGATWTNIIDATNITDLFFLDRQNIFIIKYINSEPRKSEIYKSSDGGNTWNYCFSPTDTYWPDLLLISIAAADKNNILAVGRNSSIFRSTDGGITWNREFAPNGLGLELEYDSMNYLAFPENNCAYVTGGDYMFKSEGTKILAKPILNRYSDRINPLEIKAFWSPVVGAKKYQLQLAKSPIDNVYNYNAFYYPVFDTIVKDTTFVIRNMNYNQCYYARLKAISDGMESEWNIKACMFCTFKDESYTMPPEFISPKQGEIIDTTSIDFVWTRAEGAEKYELEISDSPYFSPVISSFYGLTDTVQKGVQLTPNQYFARVKIESGSKVSDWTLIGFTVIEPTEINNKYSEMDNNISIYPNPVKDNFKVSLNMDLSGVSTILIYNIMGEQIFYEEGINSNIISVNSQSFPRGVYYCKITTGDRIFTKKFIIIK